jgi:hypothetical protein
MLTSVQHGIESSLDWHRNVVNSITLIHYTPFTPDSLRIQFIDYAKLKRYSYFHSLVFLLYLLHLTMVFSQLYIMQLVSARYMRVFDDFKELFRADKNSRNFRKVTNPYNMHRWYCYASL